MLTLLTLTATLTAPPALDLADGDRVVWVGGTLVEREQAFGRFEEALRLAHRKKNLTFRNLGWSGDTVWGESRAAFDPVAKGYERLVAMAKETKPTVLAICYGANESFAGDSGLPAFRKQYAKFLDDVATTTDRVVLITPIPFENGPGMGDVAAKNRSLKSYCDAIRSLATERNAGFVDLFAAFENETKPLTENGLHPGDDGYRRIAAALAGGTAIDDNLRAKIIAKDELFFHRWRPQNETYLFGFRKHEQGKNAKDIVAFDPLIADAEKAIAERLMAIPSK
jgi:lysophospholipase L1-like esterase